MKNDLILRLRYRMKTLLHSRERQVADDLFGSRQYRWDRPPYGAVKGLVSEWTSSDGRPTFVVVVKASELLDDFRQVLESTGEDKRLNDVIDDCVRRGWIKAGTDVRSGARTYLIHERVDEFVPEPLPTDLIRRELGELADDFRQETRKGISGVWVFHGDKWWFMFLHTETGRDSPPTATLTPDNSQLPELVERAATLLDLARAHDVPYGFWPEVELESSPIQRWGIFVRKRLTSLAVIADDEQIERVDDIAEVCAAACEALQQDLQAFAVPGGEEMPSIERPSNGLPANRKRLINARMLEIINDNDDALGWPSTKWARQLKCSRSSVTATATWKHLEACRQDKKASQMQDRRRKPKASDLNRDR